METPIPTDRQMARIKQAYRDAGYGKQTRWVNRDLFGHAIAELYIQDSDRYMVMESVVTGSPETLAWNVHENMDGELPDALNIHDFGTFKSLTAALQRLLHPEQYTWKLI